MSKQSQRRRKAGAKPTVPPDYISAGIILLDAAGRILLQLRDDDPAIMFPNHWGITGGAGREGETPAEIARREVREETGLDVAEFAQFRTYTFPDAAGERQVHIFHAPVGAGRGELRVGEGRALRFFAPEELRALDIAYNHRQVLDEFLASGSYLRYLGGGMNAETLQVESPSAADPEDDPVESFRAAVEGGRHWFEALLDVIAGWTRPEETVGGRSYRYLLEGEAFDWLLLAERICQEADGLLPAQEKEALLFHGRPPVALDDEEFRRAIGWEKYRAHLSYLYGVTVEEALQLAVEEEIDKERRAHVTGHDSVHERLYGRARDDLLAEFREQRSLPAGDSLGYGDLKRFTYWLFKYRVRSSEPARVASDTRKALAQLSRMEASVRRSGRRQPVPVADVVVDVQEASRGVR